MSRARPDLFLHEQIALLALRDEKGTPEFRAGMHGYALAGGILSELLLAGCIAAGEDKKKMVDFVKSKRFWDPLLEECLDLVATARRRRRTSDWVRKFAHLKRLRHRVAEGLCRRGILRDSEDRVLLFFTRKIYPTIDPVPERKLVARLHGAIFGDSKALEPRTAILVALAHATGLLPIHFKSRDLRRRKRRLDQITKGDLIGGATRQVVQAAQAAAMTAIMAATVATSAASR